MAKKSLNTATLYQDGLRDKETWMTSNAIRDSFVFIENKFYDLYHNLPKHQEKDYIEIAKRLEKIRIDMFKYINKNDPTS